MKEFEEIPELEKDKRFAEVDRTPQEMLSYQLGWMNLIQRWDCEELAGKIPAMPASGYKWNQMGALYQSFYRADREKSLSQLRQGFSTSVHELIVWLDGFSDDQLFNPGGRNWAASTPANWPVWKWVHINTVAPFKSFRAKVRKWKKVQAQDMERVSANTAYTP